MNILRNMETKKEDWINKTMDSVDKKERVALPEGIRQRLMAIPQEVTILNTTIPMRAVWLAAASIALLIAMNIATVKTVRSSSQQQ
jgi:hypothetical protein